MADTYSLVWSSRATNGFEVTLIDFPADFSFEFPPKTLEKRLFYWSAWPSSGSSTWSNGLPPLSTRLCA
jgi:hypothetical protein